MTLVSATTSSKIIFSCRVSSTPRGDLVSRRAQLCAELHAAIVKSCTEYRTRAMAGCHACRASGSHRCRSAATLNSLDWSTPPLLRDPVDSLTAARLLGHRSAQWNVDVHLHRFLTHSVDRCVWTHAIAVQSAVCNSLGLVGASQLNRYLMRNNSVQTVLRGATVSCVILAAPRAIAVGRSGLIHKRYRENYCSALHPRDFRHDLDSKARITGAQEPRSSGRQSLGCCAVTMDGIKVCKIDNALLSIALYAGRHNEGAQ